ncbi:MAG: aconitate hydratase AcnA [Planctomycetes bacterium]|nr:aconitate hydratase AcnA [Planctomycetota bacterium]
MPVLEAASLPNEKGRGRTVPEKQDRNAFGAKARLRTSVGEVTIHRLSQLAAAGLGDVSRLPFGMKVLVESVLRNVDGLTITEADVAAVTAWRGTATEDREVPFVPARVLLQDFTGVPAVVDLAAMRDAMLALGGDPKRINPLIPVDLVIDHSVQVDAFGSPDALDINARYEFTRNLERYQFLRWGQSAFRGFRVVPPATGIVHQVNLEYLASVVAARDVGGERVAFPDSLVGTDTHTTMINGLGVGGGGGGGIEAEAVMLGQPIYMLMPEVVGFKLTGRLREGATATDLVLTVTEMLRKKGVVGKFVEFYGDGVSAMSLPDRATVANMAPEYGATMGCFPVDDETLRYLRRTARSADLVDLVERYCKEQGLFRTDSTPEPRFSDTMALDLSAVEPSLAGPKRPQDRVLLSRVKSSFRAALRAPVAERGFALGEPDLTRNADVRLNGHSERLTHGAVVIAAITSCTNTSNPSVMIAAGLLAKKACARGLKPKGYVKTSMAPGSRVVTEYLRAAGLTPYLEQLGFHIVGYGCTTCIGNSGPLPDAVAEAVSRSDIVAAAVLSGNRNFEGRVHPQVKANYLASPPLVVAYALAGTTDIDLTSEPLGTASDGKPVYLRDIWPSQAEIDAATAQSVTPEKFREQYANVFDGNPQWNAISSTSSETYAWEATSTYVQKPPFFDGLMMAVPPIRPIAGARVLAMLGDSVTTDHISPAGSIKADSPAGRYLQEHGVKPADFNSYGSRRGNDRVMTRGTFANIRLRNLLAPGTEGGVTIHLPSGKPMSIFDAAMQYKAENTPLVVLAGKEYGSGSSRDWAAKGPALLGVRAVIAESFERIHRSNLVGMGILPLQFRRGETATSLGITGHEVFDFPGLSDGLKPREEVRGRVTDPATGRSREITVVSRIDAPVEVDYYRNGGILPAVLRRLATP